KRSRHPCWPPFASMEFESEIAPSGNPDSAKRQHALGVFAPDWLYGGKNRGWSLRYKKTRAFCTLVPEYRLFSAVVVMGGAEREKFEERRYVWRPQLVKLYDEAKTYIDGKWLTVAISSADDLHDMTELLTMKRPPPSRG
ncbi:DUF3788 domain-containing protein, partial [Bradyrhizobium sp. AS23.2]|uniref:DUF3788 domain-containing protein n=1 Tax=Bradyrhizobium sp. AS23.2 TaxID=1680155 RepID=UPI000AEE4823